MTDDTPTVTSRFKVTSEIDLYVVDPASLGRAALAQIDTMVFVLGEDAGEAQEEVRAAAREDVAGNPAAALSLLLDQDATVDVDGVEIGGSRASVEEIAVHAGARLKAPDFATLFEVCECGRSSCERCVAGFQVTPRTAALLWSMAGLLADQAYDDVLKFGDEPVTDDQGWWVFHAFPRITWTQDAVWRRRAALSFDNLGGDLEAGKWPRPGCAAEEMALHLMLRYASDAQDDGGWWGFKDHFSALPEHGGDLDWDLLGEVLFQDSDILELFDPSLDGIENPDDEENCSLGMGDYTPHAWFTPFDNEFARDPRRPFRR